MPPTNSACCGAPLSERLSPHHGTTRSPQTLAGFGQIALGEGQGFFALAACLGVGRIEIDRLIEFRRRHVEPGGRSYDRFARRGGS